MVINSTNINNTNTYFSS